MSDHPLEDEVKESTRQPASVAYNPFQNPTIPSAVAMNTRSRSSASFTTPSDSAMLSQPLFPNTAETPITPQEEATNIGDTHRRLTLAPRQSVQSTLQDLVEAQTDIIVSSFERGQKQTEAALNTMTNSIASAFNVLIQQSQTTNQLLERLVNPNNASTSEPTPLQRTHINAQAAAAATAAGARLANPASTNSNTAAIPAIPLAVRTVTHILPPDTNQKRSLNETLADYPQIRDAVNRTRRFLGSEKHKRLDKTATLPIAERAPAQSKIENYFNRLHQDLNDSAEHDIEILNRTQVSGTEALATHESSLQQFIDSVRTALDNPAAPDEAPAPQRSPTLAEDDKYESQQPTQDRPSRMKPLNDLFNEENTDDSRSPSPSPAPPAHDADYSFNVHNTTVTGRRKSRVLDTTAREDRNEGHSEREIQRLWEAFLGSPAGKRMATVKLHRRQLFHESEKAHCNDLNLVLADMEQAMDRHAVPPLHDAQRQSLFITYYLAPHSTFLDEARRWQKQGLSWATFVHKLQQQHGVTDVILENTLAKFAANYADQTPRQAYHEFRRHVQALTNARRLKEMSRARPSADAASYTMPKGEYEAHFVRAIERPFENFDTSRFKFFTNWKRDHQASDAQSAGIEYEKRVNWLQLAYEEVIKNDKRRESNERSSETRLRSDRREYPRDSRHGRRSQITINHVHADSSDSENDVDTYDEDQKYNTDLDALYEPYINYANTSSSYGPPKHQWMNSFRNRPPPNRPVQCMLCNAEGHYMSNCPMMTQLKQLLAQPNLPRAPASNVPQQLSTRLPNVADHRPAPTQQPHNNGPRVHFAETYNTEPDPHDC